MIKQEGREKLTKVEPGHDFPKLHMPCLVESILLKRSVTRQYNTSSCSEPSSKKNNQTSEHTLLRIIPCSSTKIDQSIMNIKYNHWMKDLRILMLPLYTHTHIYKYKRKLTLISRSSPSLSKYMTLQSFVSLTFPCSSTLASPSINRH